MSLKFKVTKDRVIDEELKAKVGDIVYQLNRPDYCCAIDDSLETGEPHISVTFDSDGSYPFFTIPNSSLEPV